MSLRSSDQSRILWRADNQWSFSPDPSHIGTGGPLTTHPVLFPHLCNAYANVKHISVAEIHTQQLAEALHWFLSYVERAIMVGKAK